MFRELMNLSYRRTALQAVGWYLIFLFFGAVLTVVAASIFNLVVSVGAIIVYVILLTTALFRTRPRNALNVFLAAAAVLLGVLLGALGGLIPLAVSPRRQARLLEGYCA